MGISHLIQIGSSETNKSPKQEKSVKCKLSKSRKIEVEIFHIKISGSVSLELLNPRFLFQVSEILVCI